MTAKTTSPLVATTIALMYFLRDDHDFVTNNLFTVLSYIDSSSVAVANRYIFCS